MVAKAVRHEFFAQQGIVVIYGDEGPAKDGIAVPIAALIALSAEARRLAMGMAATKAPQASHGPWHFVHHLTAQTYNVGLFPTTDGDKVSLVLDRGLDTQIGFAIEPEHARELGHELSQTADQATNSPQARN